MKKEIMKKQKNPYDTPDYGDAIGAHNCIGNRAELYRMI